MSSNVGDDGFPTVALIAHRLPLEGGREARLVLPAYLTRDDADRVIRLVQAIAQEVAQ